MNRRQERSREARERALEHTYEIMRDALQVVSANGDQYSAFAAKKALNKVDAQMRRRNI